jgi:hypothetical protein
MLMHACMSLACCRCPAAFIVETESGWAIRQGALTANSEVGTALPAASERASTVSFKKQLPPHNAWQACRPIVDVKPL